ncbi:hypothetical protein MCEGEM3_01670 [Oxalobacteraceae bacterium]|jgi:hypothetical protein
MQVLNRNLCNGIIALLSSTLVAAPSHAATYTCVTTALRGNKWICQDNVAICSFVFLVDEKDKSMVRRVNDDNPKVPVVVDKWETEKIIAHEDQTRLDKGLIEQYYYRIERDTGKFVLANEYRTNSGRYLTQEDINATDKKRFSYYRPRLFSETGSCKFDSKK